MGPRFRAGMWELQLTLPRETESGWSEEQRDSGPELRGLVAREGQ